MPTQPATPKKVEMKRTTPVKDHAESYLPAGKQWKLVWSDEFDGTALDESKWNFRTHFWGYESPTYTTEGVEVGDGTLKINMVRKGDDFYSAVLQTGSLTFDIPRDPNAKNKWYPFGAKQPAKFMHKYGYYEIRCKMPKNDGWHAAFWLQSPCIGAHPDPSVAGVEVDILETYRLKKNNTLICGCGWNGYGPDSRWFGHYEYPFVETADEWHYLGVDWSPEGYIFYCDGMEVGRQMAPECAVSNIEEFVLVSCECHGYHRTFRVAGEAGVSAKTGSWGDPVPELFEAYPDRFEVDFVRVFDAVEE